MFKMRHLVQHYEEAHRANVAYEGLAIEQTAKLGLHGPHNDVGS